MREYQLAISNIAWQQSDDEEIYTAMQHCGFTGLEIAPTRIFPSEPYENLTGAALFGGYLRNRWGFHVPSLQSIWYGLEGNIFDPADNGFYKLVPGCDRAALKAFFAANDFNALAFTDARSRYQFYPLARLWRDISAALAADLRLLHLCTPPVTAGAVYTALTGRTDWANTLPGVPFDYDLRSRHAAVLGGAGDYLCTQEEEINDIMQFMQNWRD